MKHSPEALIPTADLPLTNKIHVWEILWLCGRYKMVQELKCDNMNPFVGALGNQEPVNLGQSQIIG